VAIVPTPPLTVPPHSLVRAADTTHDNDPDWEKGLTYAPEEPGGYVARAAMNCGTGDDVDHLSTVPDAVAYAPWEAEFHDPCELTVGYKPDEVTARLRRVVDATESYAIARELWAGEVATAFDLPNAYLGRNPTILGGGAGLSPKRGIGLLEEAIGDSLRGGQAFLHVSRAARPYFYELVKVGNLLYTNLDNVIVADSGYPGTAPDGEAGADGVAWIYATGPVIVRRTPLVMYATEDAQVIDTRTNRRYRTASKLVAATFDPAHLFAVPVTLS
jgi:hypothetical protein